MKSTVKVIEMTCEALPSQWEGTFDDGESLYIRYRWGVLRVEKLNDIIFQMAYGDELSGSMNSEEMMMLTESIIDWQRSAVKAADIVYDE